MSILRILFWTSSRGGRLRPVTLPSGVPRLLELFDLVRACGRGEWTREERGEPLRGLLSPGDPVCVGSGGRGARVGKRVDGGESRFTTKLLLLALLFSFARIPSEGGEVGGVEVAAGSRFCANFASISMSIPDKETSE